MAEHDDWQVWCVPCGARGYHHRMYTDCLDPLADLPRTERAQPSPYSDHGALGDIDLGPPPAVAWRASDPQDAQPSAALPEVYADGWRREPDDALAFALFVAMVGGVEAGGTVDQWATMSESARDGYRVGARAARGFLAAERAAADGAALETALPTPLETVDIAVPISTGLVIESSPLLTQDKDDAWLADGEPLPFKMDPKRADDPHDFAWVSAMVTLEEERGDLLPHGAAGGVVARARRKQETETTYDHSDKTPAELARERGVSPAKKGTRR